MSDLLTRLSDAPLTGGLLRAMGVPSPAHLEREEGAYDLDPLTGKRVMASNTALAREALGALGATIVDATSDVEVLLYDATDARTPEDLEALYAFFHEHVPELAASSKVLVLAPALSDQGAQAAATSRAIEGFTRSLAKELGRRGATANLLRVGHDGRDRLVGPMRFFLTPRSAYVSGQVLHVTGQARPSGSFAMPLLEDQKALVTGAARGLGKATARRLATEGAQVMVVDLPSAREDLETVADEIHGEAILLDITDEDAASVLPTPDVIVHNAGITRDKILHKMTSEAWSSVLEVNLEAILRLDEALLEKIPEGGRAVYISSVSGIAGNVGQTNYAASKAALIGYVHDQAVKHAQRGITMNAIAPGFIETAMTEKMPATRRMVARRLNALQQGGQPRDVAEAVTFLASPEADGVTGQTLRVCGQSMMGA